MDFKSKIILISGPTASGKSSFAIKLAKKVNGEIINADSMQIYKELEIVSARPSKSDNKLISLSKEKMGYKIPQGKMFKYVSCPNYLGEIIEWLGFFMIAPSLASLSFFLWTSFNLIPRAINHHKWYNRKFKNYPKNRKAIIPFFL